MDFTSYTSLNKEDFTLVEPTKVKELEPTFYKYNKDLNIIICSKCLLALLNNKDIIKHLKTRYLDYYNSIKENKELITRLEGLSITSYNSIITIPFNTYYFKDIPITFNSYKCIKCDFITTSSKVIRKHLINIENIKNTTKNKSKDIIYNIPIQILYSTLNKGIFIPKLPSIDSNSNIRENPTLNYTSIFSNYINKREELVIKAKEIGEDNIIDNKGLSSFLKNSRFNLYFKDKNIKDLLVLIDPIKEEEKELNLNYLENITLDIAYNTSSLIPNIIRSIRLDIKEDIIIDSFSFNKDFIELESNTKKEYFKVFNNLILFIFRVYLIKNSLIESNTKEYILKEIDFPININNLSTKIIELLYLLVDKEYTSIEEEKQDLLYKEIYNLIIDLFIELLEIPIKFSTLKEYTLFKNPIIVFFILNTINPIDYTYRREDYIANLASKIIYNSRLFFISKLNKLEEGDTTIDLDTYYKEYSYKYLKSNSRNYFAEIIAIRRYCLKISKDQLSKNRPILEVDLDSILVYNKLYTITGLRTLYNNILYKLEDLLFNKLINIDLDLLPRINLNTIKDNRSLSNINEYILDNPTLV